MWVKDKKDDLYKTGRESALSCADSKTYPGSMAEELHQLPLHGLNTKIPPGTRRTAQNLATPQSSLTAATSQQVA